MSGLKEPLIDPKAKEEVAGPPPELGNADGLTSAEASIRQATYGFNEFKEVKQGVLGRLWKQFWGEKYHYLMPKPIPFMMWVAIIVSLSTGDYADFGVIMGLHSLNCLMAFYEETKAGNAVAALKAALAPKARVKRDGTWVNLPARELVPGDVLMLKIGDIVPADCQLLEDPQAPGGSCDLDQSGLTGESLPVEKFAGDRIFSGTIVKRGEMDAIVTDIGERTEFGKTAALIQSVEALGHFQKVMDRITSSLVVFAIVTNAILAIIEGVLANTPDLKLQTCGTPFATKTITDPISMAKDSKPYYIEHAISGFPYHAGVWMCTTAAGLPVECVNQNCFDSLAGGILQRFVVLLVATIPIATPVVCTATMAVGARRMADANAIVSRLSAIEELAGMTVLCSDKTGTLTKNILTLDDPWCVDAKNGEEMVFMAALACKTNDPDAIDTCIRQSATNQNELNSYTTLNFIPFDPSNRRTEATLRGPDDRVFKVTKGAPQVILKMAYNKSEIEDSVNSCVQDFAGRGLRSLGVARADEDGRWVFLGVLSLFDPPRDDTRDTIEKAIALGSQVKMITGDHLLIAKETARRLGMGVNILDTKAIDGKDESAMMELVNEVDGFAEVFPEHKFNIVHWFQKSGHITGMTGDGVNDAPALKRADVGFAVHGATPAAQGAASVVLLSPGLSVIITAIIRSRKIFQRLSNYVVYRINVSIMLLSFFFFSIVIFKQNLPALIIVLMALINDLAVMTIAYDKVIPGGRPERWNLVQVAAVSTGMAFVATIGGLVFLMLLQKGYCFWIPVGPDSTFKFVTYQDPTLTNGVDLLGIFNEPGTQAKLNMMVFLYLSLVNEFCVFSARVKSFFWLRRPGYVLLTVVALELAGSVLVSLFWPEWDFSQHGRLEMTRIEGRLVGATIVWVLGIFVFQEITKLILNHVTEFKPSKAEELRSLRGQIMRQSASIAYDEGKKRASRASRASRGN